MAPDRTVIYPDANWLLSALAQSAAAIVAIVGGFLVSRLVAAATEGRGARARLVELEGQLLLTEVERTRAERRLLEYEALDFLDEARDQIVESKGQVSLEHLMKRFNAFERSADELEPFYSWMVSAVKRAWDAEPVDHSTSPFVVYGVTSLLEDIVLAVQRARSSERQRGLLGLVAVPANLNAAVAAEERQRHGQLVRDVDATRTKSRELKTLGEVPRRQLAGLVSPSTVWTGIGILGYITAVGIAFPLAVLAAHPDRVGAGLRWLIWSLFVAGLVALIGYLIALAWLSTRQRPGIPPRM